MPMPRHRIFLLAIGLLVSLSVNAQAQTWTYVQDSLLTGCSANSNSCSVGAFNIILTTAGTVWLVAIHTPNNVTISSVTGGGGWTLCPASSCHVYNATLGDNVDVAYNLAGSPGTTQITISLSGNPGAFFGGNFLELLPPAGATASLDAVSTNSSSTCTTACQGVGLTLSATDAVLQIIHGNSPGPWNGWSSPYTTLPLGEGVYLNAPSGVSSAPTVVTNGTGGTFVGIAFKSTAGSFTPPPPQPISVVNYTSINVPSCSVTCSLTIPSTGSGHLLYLQSGTLQGTHISSVSGGGTWVIPSGANTCQITLSPSDTLSCAYVLSSTAGATTLNVTMSGSSNVSFTITEVASTSGSFVFDAQGSATNAASYNPKGVTLTLGGTDDVIFQAAFVPGGTSSVSFYTQGNLNFLNNDGGQVARLNTADGTSPTWVNEQNNATVVTGIAFKTTPSALPAPPTNLGAVVH